MPLLYISAVLSLSLCALHSTSSPFVFICPFHIFSLLFHLWRLFFSFLFFVLLSPTVSSHFPSLCIPTPSPQVDYRTEDGTANAGSDYEFAEGTLLFKPGESLKGKNNSDRNNS